MILRISTLLFFLLSGTSLFANDCTSLLTHRLAGVLPKYLRSQAMVYVRDAFTTSEQARLSEALEQTAVAMDLDKTLSAEDALKSASDSEIIAKVIQLDQEVQNLKKLHKQAVVLALEYHDKRGQLYGEYPYSTHLRKVRAVLKRFGYGPKHSLLGLRLGTAAWLHDIVEDTPVSRETLALTFGDDLAEIVMNLTNEPDREGLSKEEQKTITFKRVASRIESRIIKLADRIANVEESLANAATGKVTKIEKYRKEWPAFKNHIQIAHEAEAMWAHLSSLLDNAK